MKSDNLRRMRDHGLPVPEFAVFYPSEPVSLVFSDAQQFAVRSSFDVEDSAELSFAGQFDTLLNVSRADVPDAVARVRESYGRCYSDYAKAHGLDADLAHEDAPVIVQAMVPAEQSGVLFTSNPTGLLNELVIICGSGLLPGIIRIRKINHIVLLTGDSAIHRQPPA